MQENTYPSFNDSNYNVMWNASLLTNSIDYKTGKLSDNYKTTEHYKEAGFTADVYAYSGGDGNINAGLVGSTEDGVIMAFRGTLGPFDDLRDWLQNIDSHQVDFPGGIGKIHHGFFNAVNSIFQSISSKAEELVKKSSCQNPKLYVTGHSKGGAMATIAAMLLKTAGKNVSAVYTYGAPRVGDEKFKSNYNTAIDHNRYEAFLDLVPHLPFTNQEKILFPRFSTITEDLKTLIELFPPYCSVGKRFCIYDPHGEYGHLPYKTNNPSGETLNSLCAIEKIIRELNSELINDCHNKDYYLKQE